MKYGAAYAVFFILSRPAGFFVAAKGIQMQIPKFLRELINSAEYADKNSDTYVRVTKYMNLLYPGQIEFDETGKMIEPPYDMTYEQFLRVQKELDEDVQNAIQEAEEEAEEEKGTSVDYSEFVEIEETIDVRVLMPFGYIDNKKLVVCTLNIPEESNSDKPKVKKIWVWHSESDELICDDCALHDGEVFKNTAEIPELPVHPNCRCWVEEQKLDDNNKIVSSRVYKGRKKENENKTNEASNMKISDNGINMLKHFEGSVKIGDKHVIYDDKTGKPINQNEELPKGATIGYGHLIKSDENFRNSITERQATEILRSDIKAAEHAVKDNITVPLSQNQFDALVSLAYNIGARNFADSTVVKYVNDSNYHNSKYPTLESAWLAWNKSGGKEMPGLSNRRHQEFNLFNN